MQWRAVASIVLSGAAWERSATRDPRLPPPAEPVIAFAPVQRAEDAEPAPLTAAPPAEDAASRTPEPVVEELAIAGDLPGYVVRAAREGHAAPIVFLTGSCSHPRPSLEAFRRAAAAHGGVVALQGDLPCKGPDATLRRFSSDTAVLTARIDAALAAAGVEHPADLVLMGYSQGAERAEWLANRAPEHFTRFVLMAGPVVPSGARMGRARAVVTLAGHGDVRENMAEGARQLRRAHVPATYVEIPGTQHGELSPAIDPFVDQALEWLDRNALSLAVERGDAELVGEHRIVVDRRAQRSLREPNPASHGVERHARGGSHLGQ